MCSASRFIFFCGMENIFLLQFCSGSPNAPNRASPFFGCLYCFHRPHPRTRPARYRVGFYFLFIRPPPKSIFSYYTSNFSLMERRNRFLSIVAFSLLIAVPVYASPVVWVASDHDYVPGNGGLSGFSLIDVNNSYSVDDLTFSDNIIGAIHYPIPRLGISPDSSTIIGGTSVQFSANTNARTIYGMGQADTNFTGDSVFSPDGTSVYLLSNNNNTAEFLHYAVLHDSTLSPVNSMTLAYPYIPLRHFQYASTTLLYANGGGTLEVLSRDLMLADGVHMQIRSATTTTGEDIALSADNRKLYIAEPSSASVTVMDTATLMNTASITVGNTPGRIGIPRGANKLYVLNTGDGTVSVINLTTETVQSTITIGAGKDLKDISFSPDGTKAFVLSGHYYSTGESEVVVINTATDLVVNTVSLPNKFYSQALVVADTNYTPSGANIHAQPSGGVDTTFSNVSVSGVTTVTSTTTAPAFPAGFSVTGDAFYVDISTTAVHTGTTSICIHYNHSSYDSTVALLHYELGQWVDRTTSNDTNALIVCGTVSSLSPFALAYNSRTPVTIDIVPKKTPNRIVLHSENGVPVAIFGSNTVDVTHIDLSSLRLAGASIKHESNGAAMAKFKDVNNDGKIDVVVRFVTDELTLTPADTTAELTGTLSGGSVIAGTDSVQVFACHEDDAECEE